MRRVLWMAASVLFVFGSAAAQAQPQPQIINLTATLTGANETPALVLTGAFANAMVTVNMTTQTVTWNINVFNLPSGMTNAHFHVGGPGLGGPTVVNIPFPAGISNDFNLTGSATTFSTLQPNQGIRSWEDFLQAVLGGQTYLNIHTTVNPGGEIRGPVVRVMQLQGPGSE